MSIIKETEEILNDYFILLKIRNQMIPELMLENILN